MTRLTEMFAYGALACSSFLFGTGAYRVAVDGTLSAILMTIVWAGMVWCNIWLLRRCRAVALTTLSLPLADEIAAAAQSAVEQGIGSGKAWGCGMLLLT